MPGGVPVWPGKAPNPGGRPYGDAVDNVTVCKHVELKWLIFSAFLTSIRVERHDDSLKIISS